MCCFFSSFITLNMSIISSSMHYILESIKKPLLSMEFAPILLSHIVVAPNTRGSRSHPPPINNDGFKVIPTVAVSCVRVSPHMLASPSYLLQPLRMVPTSLCRHPLDLPGSGCRRWRLEQNKRSGCHAREGRGSSGTR